MTDTSVVSPKIDLVFKLIFGSSEQPQQLLDLVNAILEAFDEPKVTTLSVQNASLNPQHLLDKLAVLDIKAKTERDEPINIEMQIIDQHDWQKRSLYYWARLFSEQIERGDDYRHLQKTISISLLDFTLFQRDRMYSLYELQERLDHQPLSHMLQMYFIELPKAHTETAIPAHLADWVHFLNIETSTEFDNLCKDNPAIQEACSMLNRINQNPEERALIDARRKALLDYNTNMRGEREKGHRQGLAEGLERGMGQGLARGRKEGLEEGMEKGMERGVRATAKTMKQQGFEVAVITNITGLSAAEINSL